MEKKNLDLIKKIVIVLCIIGVCALYLLFVNHGEGDPFFVFYEVQVNDTINSTVIHLEEKDILNVRGLDVRQKNGKIDRIYFRYSDTTPEISSNDFNLKYGSKLSDLTSRKYIEYKGVHYYIIRYIP